MNYTILFLTVVIFSTLDVLGQSRCGTYDYELYLDRLHPGFTNALQESREHALSSSQRVSQKAEQDTLFRIPVVFHILWNTTEQNLHDSLIYSQVKALNEAFRYMHKDSAMIRDIFKPLAGDSKIEFYLAENDPDGGKTNGINRVQTAREDFGDSNSLYADDVKLAIEKGVDAWNPEKYLNIWVCNFTFRGFRIISGYAHPPTNAQFWDSVYYTTLPMQGVVMNFQYIGFQNPNDLSPTSGREKILVHEVGHYLGLRHIWADKSTCLGDDDGLDDTPFASSPSRTCDFTKNTCWEGQSDLPDMIENYMDYSPNSCLHMFTKKQIQLMKYNLQTLRPNLSESIISTLPGLQRTDSGLLLFPNPAHESLTIQVYDSGHYTLQIIDMMGKVLGDINAFIDLNLQYSIDLRSLSSGIYYIKATRVGEDPKSGKIVVY